MQARRTCASPIPRSGLRELAGAACISLASLAGITDPAVALPPGRAWAPVQQLVVPDYSYLPSPRLETDINGFPLMFVVANYGSVWDGVGLQWGDSTWEVVVQTDLAVGTLQPVVSPPGTFYLVWAGSEPGSAGLLQMAEFRPDGLFAHDTLAHVREYTSLYTGAVAPGGRRWVGVNDNFRPRLLYSDAPREWREVPLPFPDGGCLAVSPLSDTTALVLVRVQGFMRWGIANSQTWQELGQLTEFGGDMKTFRLRPRASGEHLLIWDSYYSYVTVASFRDGSWSAAETLTCAYPDPRVDYTFWPSMSRDGGRYPVVTWQAYNGWLGGDVICACLPTDSGFTVADQIWSATYAMDPVAARDVNGDAWVAWWSYQGGTFWTHTYTRAEASAPTVLTAGGTIVVNWNLSTPAPETWWGVLRSRDAGPYEPVGRVRAGPRPSLAWTDSQPPPGVLRYRVRRESVDTRYRRESADAVITVGVTPTLQAGGLRVTRASAHPIVTGTPTRFWVANAGAGPLTIRMFDLHGREVHRQVALASGAGGDTIDVLLPAGRALPGPGVYFLTFTDSARRESVTLKVAILR